MITPLVVGDFVRVVSGPAYAGPLARPIKGRIQEITNAGLAAIVQVAPGRCWGFMVSDLKRLPSRGGSL